MYVGIEFKCLVAIVVLTISTVWWFYIGDKKHTKPKQEPVDIRQKRREFYTSSAVVVTSDDTKCTDGGNLRADHKDHAGGTTQLCSKDISSTVNKFKLDVPMSGESSHIIHPLKTRCEEKSATESPPPDSKFTSRTSFLDATTPSCDSIMMTKINPTSVSLDTTIQEVIPSNSEEGIASKVVSENCLAAVSDQVAKPDRSLVSNEEFIFGDDDVKALSTVLLNHVSTTSALSVAAGWWGRARERAALDEYQLLITEAVHVLMKDRLPEEDLFTCCPADDLAVVLVEFLGYAVVSSYRNDGRMETVLKVVSARPQIPSNFVRMIYQIDLACSSSSFKIIFSPLETYSLNQSLTDIFDSSVLVALSCDRNLCCALSMMMEIEARSSMSMNHPGQMQYSSVLLSLLSHTTVVPFGAVPFRGEGQTKSTSKYPQMSYFSTMPTFPALSKIGCPNQAMCAQQMRMLNYNLSVLQDVLVKMLKVCLGRKVNGGEGVLAWLSRVIHMTHRFFSIESRDGLFADEKTEVMTQTAPSSGPSFCSTGFTLNVVYLILKLSLPIFQNSSAENVASIDWQYLLHDWRIEFSALSNMSDGRKAGSAVSAFSFRDEDAEIFDDVLPPTTPLSGFSPQESSAPKFPFKTEIFWLTVRALELIDKIDHRRKEQLRVAHEHFIQALQTHEKTGSLSSEAAVTHAKKCYHMLYYGWSSSQLCDSQFLSDACIWAKFSTEWILLQASAEDAKIRFQRIPAGLVKGMCSVWTLAAHNCPDAALPGIMSADAALFCVEMMNRPDIASSPVLLDCLLSVVETFVRSGRNSLVGVVMDNQRIRETLVPAVMTLYSACHAVAALDVNEDTSFNKHSIRYKSNGLISYLFQYSLPEPRESVRVYTQQSTQSFEAFVRSAFDCIIYMILEATKVLTVGRQHEQSNRPINPTLKATSMSLLRTYNSTFEMLFILCDGEAAVREGMTSPGICHAVATWLYTCLYEVCSLGRLESLRVKEASEWGYNEITIVSHPANLLALCLDGANSEGMSAFVTALSEHSDYEPLFLQAVSRIPGGEALNRHAAVLDNMPAPSQTAEIEGSSNEQGEEIQWDEFVEEDSRFDPDERYKLLLECDENEQVSRSGL